MTERSRDCKPLIQGATFSDGARHSYELRSPRDLSVLSIVESASTSDVDEAVYGARHCSKGLWSQQEPNARKAILLRWADLVDARRTEIARLITLECGKPIRDSLEIDVAGLSRGLRWAGENGSRSVDKSSRQGRNELAIVERRPVGVVAVIAPWNFPLASISYECAPALMLGNSVIVKPSEKTPLAVSLVCALALKAGVPPGALSVLPGDRETGRLLGLHQDIDALTVIGSQNTGQAFLEYSAQSNGKRIWPELGGKTAAFICSDCSDLDRAAREISWGVYFNQGQMCTGISRIFVHEGVLDRFSNLLAIELSRISPQDPLLPETCLGAIVSQEAADTMLASVASMVSAGAHVATGGAQVDSVLGGAYVLPTLLLDVNESASVWSEELFAPLAAICSFKEISEPIERECSAGFGMGLSMWTASLADALSVSRQTHVGSFWVNCFEADDLSVPAGGVRRSGYGATKGENVFRKYSDDLTVWARMDV